MIVTAVIATAIDTVVFHCLDRSVSCHFLQGHQLPPRGETNPAGQRRLLGGLGDRRTVLQTRVHELESQHLPLQVNFGHPNP